MDPDALPSNEDIATQEAAIAGGFIPPAPPPMIMSPTVPRFGKRSAVPSAAASTTDATTTPAPVPDANPAPPTAATFIPRQIPRHGAPVLPKLSLATSFTPLPDQTLRQREAIAKAQLLLQQTIKLARTNAATVEKIIAEVEGAQGGSFEMDRMDFDATHVRAFLTTLGTAIDVATTPAPTPA